MTHPISDPPPSGPGRALTAEERADRYRRQNGSTKLTPRQRRRLNHKANRASARLATPNSPYLAKGGTITRSGLAVVGERGPEPLSLTRGAQVTR